MTALDKVAREKIDQGMNEVMRTLATGEADVSYDLFKNIMALFKIDIDHLADKKEYKILEDDVRSLKANVQSSEQKMAHASPSWRKILHEKGNFGMLENVPKSKPKHQSKRPWSLFQSRRKAMTCSTSLGKC